MMRNGEWSITKQTEKGSIVAEHSRNCVVFVEQKIAPNDEEDRDRKRKERSLLQKGNWWKQIVRQKKEGMSRR